MFTFLSLTYSYDCEMTARTISLKGILMPCCKTFLPFLLMLSNGCWPGFWQLPHSHMPSTVSAKYMNILQALTSLALHTFNSISYQGICQALLSFFSFSPVKVQKLKVVGWCNHRAGFILCVSYTPEILVLHSLVSPVLKTIAPYIQSGLIWVLGAG